jgi:hypothetical protein
MRGCLHTEDRPAFRSIAFPVYWLAHLRVCTADGQKVLVSFISRPDHPPTHKVEITFPGHCRAKPGSRLTWYPLIDRLICTLRPPSAALLSGRSSTSALASAAPPVAPFEGFTSQLRRPNPHSANARPSSSAKKVLLGTAGGSCPIIWPPDVKDRTKARSDEALRRMSKPVQKRNENTRGYKSSSCFASAPLICQNLKVHWACCGRYRATKSTATDRSINRFMFVPTTDTHHLPLLLVTHCPKKLPPESPAPVQEM